jgi:hypothetical protein
MKTKFSQFPSGSKVGSLEHPKNASLVVRSPVVAPKKFQHISLSTGHVCEQDFSETPENMRNSCKENFDEIMQFPEGKVMMARHSGEWPARFTLDGTNLMVELFRSDDKAMKDVPEVWFGVAVDASQGFPLWQLLHHKAVEYGLPSVRGRRLNMPNSPWIAAALNQKINLKSIGLDDIVQRFFLQGWVGQYEVMIALGFSEWLISRQSK